MPGIARNCGLRRRILRRDMAQEEYAQSQAKRYAELTRQGVLAKDSAEQTECSGQAAVEAVRADRAAIESAQANTAADQAALDRAKLQLEYCTIRSPIDGRTGRLLVKQGNVVKATDVDLVTINQVRPIFVTFNVPGSESCIDQDAYGSGKVSVDAHLQDGDNVAERGKLSFVENAVDSATGTIRLKAIFDNAQTKLWPGQFVRVVVRMNVARRFDRHSDDCGPDRSGWKVRLCREAGYDRGSAAGHYRTNSGTEIVVEKGLSEGETVVTSGQLRLISGSRVQVKHGCVARQV